ncbi:hypothetical protein [Neomoorella thermoacetica]|nr:hypothetical protein [Moorella thermoacetica]
MTKSKRTLIIRAFFVVDPEVIAEQNLRQGCQNKIREDEAG